MIQAFVYVYSLPHCRPIAMEIGWKQAEEQARKQGWYEPGKDWVGVEASCGADAFMLAMDFALGRETPAVAASRQHHLNLSVVNCGTCS